MNTPLFSVIVPIYNVSRYLPQCIESVLNQEFRDFELILVDDGSTDNSGEICDQFQEQDARVKVIHKLNGGLVSARIAGIQSAIGKYVYNLDGDDFIASDLLENLYAIISAHEPDIISFGFQTIDEKGQEGAPQNDFLKEGLYKKEDLEAVFPRLIYDPDCKNFNSCSAMRFSIWSKTFRRDLMLPVQSQIPTTISRGEDVAAVMTAICRCKSLYVASFVGYHYRIQSASMTHTFKPSGLDALLVLVEYLKHNATKIPERNIEQFAMTEIFYHTKDAVNGFSDYREYKRYLEKIFTKRIWDIVMCFSLGMLTVSRKIQIIAIKWKLWWLYWCVYRR